jgi:hypothetical protein
LNCSMACNKLEVSRDYISQMGGIYSGASKRFSKGVGVRSRPLDTKKSLAQFLG